MSKHKNKSSSVHSGVFSANLKALKMVVRLTPGVLFFLRIEFVVFRVQPLCDFMVFGKNNTGTFRKQRSRSFAAPCALATCRNDPDLFYHRVAHTLA